MYFLFFLIRGSLATWGKAHIGIERTSRPAPPKATIMGMIQAAFGVKRHQEEKLIEIFNSFDICVQILREGVLKTDYQTIKTPKNAPEIDYNQTRYDELNPRNYTKKNIDTRLFHTTQSYRDYYADAMYLVCIWKSTEDATYDLEEIKHKLNYPEFPLYLGRKSCPPSLPLQPKIVEANNLKEALESINIREDFVIPDNILLENKLRTFWDENENSIEHDQLIINKRDVPLSRRSWTFTTRNEKYALMEWRD